MINPSELQKSNKSSKHKICIEESHYSWEGGGAQPRNLLEDSLGFRSWLVEHQKKLTRESSWDGTRVHISTRAYTVYYVHLEDRLGRDSSICPRADRISIRRWSDGRGTATSSRPIVTEEAWEEKPQNKLMLFASRQGSRIFFAYRTYSYSVSPEISGTPWYGLSWDARKSRDSQEI